MLGIQKEKKKNDFDDLLMDVGGMNSKNKKKNNDFFSDLQFWYIFQFIIYFNNKILSNWMKTIVSFYFQWFLSKILPFMKMAWQIQQSLINLSLLI